MALWTEHMRDKKADITLCLKCNGFAAFHDIKRKIKWQSISIVRVQTRLVLQIQQDKRPQSQINCKYAGLHGVNTFVLS